MNLQKPGCFIDGGKSYLLETNRPPREWVNAHFSGPVGSYRYWTRFSHTGSGESFCVDGAGNRCNLTSPGGRKTIWIRDEDTGRLFSPAGYPVPTPVEGYKCRFSQGDTEITSRFDGLEFSWRCFVPEGWPCEIWTLTIRNCGADTRNLSVFPYVEIGIDGFECSYAYGNWHKTADFDPGLYGMIARNRYPNPNPDLYGALLLSSVPPSGGAGGNEPFFSPSFSMAHPRLVLRENFDDRSWAHDETGEALALQVKTGLCSGEVRRLDFAFGISGDEAHRSRLFRLLTNPSAVDELLAARRDEEEARIETSSLRTGEDRVDRQFNFWLKKQMRSYLVYKTGVRDNLQTHTAYCSVDRKAVEGQFLSLLASQRADGSFPHSWSPLNPALYGDKAAWLLLTLPALIRESGDFSFLDKQVSFAEADSSGASVLEHLIRAYLFLKKSRGPIGFHLIRTADWNDDLDGPGKDGGESILVTQIVCAGLRECRALFLRIGRMELADDFREHFLELEALLNNDGWDGEWYLRAFTGAGARVGSRENSEGQLFLNTQAWAVLSGTAPPERQAVMSRAVDEHLNTPLGMKVLHPTYTSFDPAVGSLSAALPGFYVNGIYVHANTFQIAADFCAGRPDRGWETLGKILPDSPENPVENSQCEPFALANCYRADGLRPGLSGDVWHSGSSAWIYLILLEYLAGMRGDFDGLRIGPCLPSAFDQLKAERVFRGCRYHLHVEKTPEAAGREAVRLRQLTVDGIRVEGPLVRHLEGRSECRLEAVVE